MPEDEAQQPEESQTIPQLSEGESALIYDEMLHSGRIFQVTSGGVRVFDRSGIFIREAVLKAKFVFPRIDLTPGLQRMLERLSEPDEGKVDRIRSELYQSVHKPIKQNLDVLVQDSRLFFGDPEGLRQVRTDLRRVVERFDLLTLGMLNDILSNSELEFRRRIEVGVYSGLAGSVIFGDYKRKLNDRKVVEDLIMMGIVYGLGSELDKSSSFQELCRTSKSFYDVEMILNEVRSKPEEPTNVLSEILAVSLRYIEVLDQEPDRDPLGGLVALMRSCSERHSIAVGALTHKYAIGEYVGSYLIRDAVFQTRLAESEDHYEQMLRRRMDIDQGSATQKLGSLFLRGLRFKATLRVGANTVQALDEFMNALLPAKSVLEEVRDQLLVPENVVAKELKSVLDELSEAIEICLDQHAQYTNTANWPDLEHMPGAAYLIAYRHQAELEYAMQHLIRRIEYFRKRIESVGVAASSVSGLDELQGLLATVMGSKSSMHPQLYDVASVLRELKEPFEQQFRITLSAGIPHEAVSVVVDPIGFEELIERILATIAASPPSTPSSTASSPVGLVLSVGEHACLIEIGATHATLPAEAIELQQQAESLAPGVVFRVRAGDGAGVTFLIGLPLVKQHVAAPAASSI